MVRVIWTADAIAQLDFIRRYVAAFNPHAAGKLVERLVDAAESLGSFPDRGRPASNGCRELVTIRPYLIRYEVTEAGVTILRLRHAARLPDDDV